LTTPANPPESAIKPPLLHHAAGRNLSLSAFIRIPAAVRWSIRCEASPGRQYLLHGCRFRHEVCPCAGFACGAPTGAAATGARHTHCPQKKIGSTPERLSRAPFVEQSAENEVCGEGRRKRVNDGRCMSLGPLPGGKRAQTNFAGRLYVRAHIPKCAGARRSAIKLLETRNFR
jgi:hypothetical protein